MNKSIKLIIFIGIFGMIPMGFIGCFKIDKLITTAKNNINIESELPQYKLNKDNFKELNYKDKLYIIKEDILEPKNIGNPIGKVNINVVINEDYDILDRKELKKIYINPKKINSKRINLNFGWIHEIKDADTKNKIAVLINHQYYLGVEKN